MMKDILAAEQQHLASLLEAIQRCVFFLEASNKKLAWPLWPCHGGAFTKRKIKRSF